MKTHKMEKDGRTVFTSWAALASPERARRAAFTLVELLVVIAVTATLASLLLSSHARARNQGKRAQCSSNLRQWDIAVNLYCGDNQGNMPMGWYAAEVTPPYPVSMGEFSMALKRYLNTNINIALCPMATTFRSSLTDVWTEYNAQNVAWGIMGSNGYPVEPWGVAGLYGSYGINGWMYNPPAVPTSEIPANEVNSFWRKLSAAVPGNNVPLIADCIYDGALPADTDTPPSIANESEINSDMSNYCITRHDGQRPVLMSFADSSVRSVGLKELWTLNWSTEFNTGLTHRWPA
jgi:prepilin-type N-terminal cleavage/methylation domain-containing protein